MDPDTVWGGEWGQSRMSVLDGVVIVEGEGAVMGLNLRRPIVTKGVFVAYIVVRKCVNRWSCRLKW